MRSTNSLKLGVKMLCKFPSKDLIQRLDHTICLYKNHPYYIRVGDASGLVLYNLEDSSNKSGFPIKSSDEALDISTPPLGYLQYSNNVVYYVTRKPSRIYKQGISLDNLSFTLIGKFQAKHLPDIRGAFRSINFTNMITNNFPTWRTALDTFKGLDYDSQIAVSRHVCLEYVHANKVVHVYYKNSKDPIGWMTLNSDTVIVPNTEMSWVISIELSGLNWKVE